MPLFERKTEQERAAAKAEKDRLALLERDRKQAEKATAAEQKRQRDAVAAAHVAGLPKFNTRRW
jgi:hypothetical protein